MSIISTKRFIESVNGEHKSKIAKLDDTINKFDSTAKNVSLQNEKQHHKPLPFQSVNIGKSLQSSRVEGGTSIDSRDSKIQLSGRACKSLLASKDVYKSYGNGNNRGENGKLQHQLSYQQPRTSSNEDTEGQMIMLKGNYFALNKSERWTLFKSHVEFNPEEERTFVRKSLMRQHESRFKVYLFDGSTLFTNVNPCTEGTVLELVSKKKDLSEVIITVKFVGFCEPSDFQYLQVFNIIMRDCLQHLRLKMIRRNYFDPNAKISIPQHKLELWPGYETSMLQCRGQILLQTAITYKTLRKDTAYDILRNFMDNSIRGVCFRIQFSTAIIGSVVLTRYNNRTYKISDVDYGSSPRSTFETMKDGEKKCMSFVEYYSSKYGILINDQRQPLLVCWSTKNRQGEREFVKLIPELCTMTGLSTEMRNNFALMKEVSNTTNLSPSSRVERLMNFNKRLNGIPEIREKLSKWGLEFSTNVLDVPGRILPNETIHCGKDCKISSGPNVDWTNFIRSQPMLLSIDLKDWVVLFPEKNRNDVNRFLSTFNKCASGLGFNVDKPPQMHGLGSDHPNDYIRGLEQSINQYNPKFVMCIVTNNRSDRYCVIKKKCILEKKIPSQVVTMKSVNNKNVMSIATKIVIQINCKMGGVPWSVPFKSTKLMAVGFDVCNDPQNRQRRYSATLTTLDQTCTRYFSAVSHHGVSGDDVSRYFCGNLEKGLMKYRDVNRCLPAYIAIFREGVGEGDLNNIRDSEIVKIKAMLSKLYNGMTPKLMFIVVTKKINTRLVAQNNRNPVSGTVVDDVITRPERLDFFLISQNVRFGTVSPTHYNVLFENTGLKLNQIQQMTYQFTHLYYNWSGTVRVPAPCQYANKLVYLTAQNLGEVHNNLSHLLYFL